MSPILKSFSYNDQLSKGLWRFEPVDSSACCTDDGMYTRGQNHWVLVWTATQVSEGRGPICQEDGGCVCRQVVWHITEHGGRSGRLNYFY